jgi:predicted ribosomally synthesized peptide with nif11-like leader
MEVTAVSLAAAKQYYLRLAQDAEFLQRADEAATVDGRLQVAADAGFDFTLDEVHQALVDLVSSASLESFLGGEQAEVLAYEALSLIDLQRRVSIPYGPPNYWLQPFASVPPTTTRPG